METNCTVIISMQFAAIAALFAWLKKKDLAYVKVVEERIKREQMFQEILSGLHDTQSLQDKGDDND